MARVRDGQARECRDATSSRHSRDMCARSTAGWRPCVPAVLTLQPGEACVGGYALPFCRARAEERRDPLLAVTAVGLCVVVLAGTTGVTACWPFCAKASGCLPLGRPMPR